MSKNVYTSPVYYGLSPRSMSMIMVFDAGLNYLTAHTGAIIVNRWEQEGDYQSSYIDYRVLVRASATSDAYFQITSGWNAGYNRRTLGLSSGYLNENHEFVSIVNASTDAIRYSASEQFPLYAELTVINGSIWNLEYHCPVGFDNTWGNWRGHIRSVTIESSLSNDTFYTGGAFTGDPFDHPFPDSDRIYANGAPLSVGTTYNSYAQQNIPDARALLFPNLVYANGAGCLMGVPTIDGQTLYYTAKRGLGCYDEFYVGGIRFVSLGKVCMRIV